MPTPFPGMDPYLERPGLWEEVHTNLSVMISHALNPLVRPRYRVAVERRAYIAVVVPEPFVGKPDVLVVAAPGPAGMMPSTTLVDTMPLVGELPMPEEVVERYLEVRDVITGEAITVIEILSHSNKSTREGREQYERKRLQVVGSLTNLVEIDLLRAGKPFPVRLPNDHRLKDYSIIISRAHQRPLAAVYSFSVREPIPDIPIPLRPGETEPVLALNQIVHDLYERAGYDMAVDYRQPADPPLKDEDARWAMELAHFKDDR